MAYLPRKRFFVSKLNGFSSHSRNHPRTFLSETPTSEMAEGLSLALPAWRTLNALMNVSRA